MEELQKSDMTLGDRLRATAETTNRHRARFWYNTHYKQLVQSLEKVAEDGGFEFLLIPDMFPEIYSDSPSDRQIQEFLRTNLSNEGLNMYFDEEREFFIITW